MGSVSIDLKTEREKKNISLAQIAADTHISLRYLQSIEEGRFSDLPGGLYNRAFLKAYCESINLDPQDILDSYDTQTSSSQPEKNQGSQIPLPPRQNTFSVSGPVLIWTIMLLISAVGIFFSRGWISELFSPYFINKTVAGVSYETPGGPSSDSVDAATVSSDLPVTESIAATEPSPDTETVAPVQNIPSPAVHEPAPPEAVVDSELRLEITAKEQCWISIERDGIPSTGREMEPGEIQEFNAEKRMLVTIGNAGGIQMKINDKPTKPLGSPGEVIKMNINLENLQQFIDQPTG